MNAKIQAIKDADDLQNERIVLCIENRCDIGAFLLSRVKKEDGNLTNEIKNIFWIPDTICNSGDLVVIYTRKGVDRIRLLDNGRKAYFFHWGLSDCLWDKNLADFCPVLFSVKDYVAKDSF